MLVVCLTNRTRRIDDSLAMSTLTTRLWNVPDESVLNRTLEIQRWAPGPEERRGRCFVSYFQENCEDNESRDDRVAKIA